MRYSDVSWPVAANEVVMVQALRTLWIAGLGAGCGPLVTEDVGITIPPDADADTDTDTDTDTDADPDTDTEDNADTGEEGPPGLVGEVNYDVFSPDGGLICDLSYGVTGTPYTGDCEDCSFVFSMESELISGAEGSGCPADYDTRFLFVETLGNTDFFFGHSPALTGAIYSTYEVYYDVLFIGYTDTTDTIRLQPLAKNYESSESTALGGYGQSGQFVWSGDQLEWSWTYGYYGFTVYTVTGTADMTGL